MALLGKTLKGKTTRPGGAEVKKNQKIRQISKNEVEFEENRKNALLRRTQLKTRIKDEQKIVNFNKKKLLTYWRKIMRIAKTE
jgi:hypothetical protein